MAVADFRGADQRGIATCDEGGLLLRHPFQGSMNSCSKTGSDTLPCFASLRGVGSVQGLIWGRDRYVGDSDAEDTVQTTPAIARLLVREIHPFSALEASFVSWPEAGGSVAVAAGISETKWEPPIRQ
ncbi:hypothetical protein GGTG_11927 [Gaeumannomyces tritici R3-111a-1]|uniref:Uncharacterized protein n=1 Tax=Gaeumannomyces tritici (strain R3-111a-1) TaxID=644352 RepID=J3PEJ6_GAET3|nr:hypothetical protein GGTG_11927 [Gaeumannomyces tritici R3-111a-1]EJT70904.1 hypothetical protein GGTG_11927 [Gaeumannomyces tritici R3-111a-1]